MTVTQLLEEHAAQQPDKTFLFFRDEEITYQQLTDRMRLPDFL